MKTNMNLPYPALLAAALLLALPPLAAQDIPTIILDQVEDKLMDELEDRLNPADSTDIDGEGWDDTYRTSDAEGERSTQWKLGKDTPPNGRRVGCVCMDDTRLDQTCKTEARNSGAAGTQVATDEDLSAGELEDAVTSAIALMQGHYSTFAFVCASSQAHASSSSSNTFTSNAYA